MNTSPFLTLAVSALLLSACTGGTASSSSSESISSSIPDSSSEASSSTSMVSSSSSVASSAPVQDGSISQFIDLPKEYRVSDDGERLERGGFYASKLYNEETLETVTLEFSQGDYWDQMKRNKDADNGQKVSATLRYKDKVIEGVGVGFRGLTSYSFADADKKSFSIDLDPNDAGVDINGYDELKLNNAHEDPSAMRETLFSNLIGNNIPAARANFVKLVINGRNYGIYTNLEKLEKDHVDDWFFDKDNTRWRAEVATGFSLNGGGGGGFGGGGFDFATLFGAGKSTLNDLGENGNSYTADYNLKYSDAEKAPNPWQDLANAAHTMGVASPEYIVEELGQYMNIDEALWFVASENIFADDDGYLNKGGLDYYVYFDVFTGRILPIEYDGNSAFHGPFIEEWNPLYRMDDNRFPLVDILLRVPELRARYFAHYRTIMEESLKPQVSLPVVDTYAALIGPGIADGSAVKAYSYNEHQQDVQGIKDFITRRYNYLSSHSELSGTPVVINDVVDSVDGIASIRPRDNQAVNVAATVAGSVQAAYLYYGKGLAGEFAKVAMNVNGSSLVAQIPAMPKGEFVRYYIEVIANDGKGTASYNPVGAEHDVYIYQVLAAAKINSSVVINELVADNETLQADETGEYSDWIELYNKGDTAVDLSNWYLTDEDTKLDRWKFPQGTVIAAGATLVVWADDETDTLGGLHASFKLSAGGENVYLVNGSLEIADHVEYVDAPEDQSYARQPNGTGDFSWTSNATFNGLNP